LIAALPDGLGTEDGEIFCEAPRSPDFYPEVILFTALSAFQDAFVTGVEGDVINPGSASFASPASSKSGFSLRFIRHFFATHQLKSFFLDSYLNTPVNQRI